MKFKTLLIASYFFIVSPLLASDFVEKIPVYGVIKPAAISSSLAVNHGMVYKIHFEIGDSVKIGQVLLTAIEKETTRTYRSTINGKVAKLHVTSGAALTPGMPLVTVINPKLKKIEVSLSPEEAQKIKIGALVYNSSSQKNFGKLSKKSPLVDPDNGAVLSYIKPKQKISQLIGDIIPLEIEGKSFFDCKVVSLQQVEEFLQEYTVEATSGENVCLRKKKE